MDKGKMLWTILGFGIAMSVVGAGAYFYTTEGAPEDEIDDTVQPMNGIYLMKIEGISGEVTYGEYSDWMVLKSFALPGISTESEGTGQTRQRGDVIIEDVQCAKELDKASPKLAEAVCKGNVYPLVEVRYCSDSPDGELVTIMSYVFKNVYLNSYIVGSPGSNLPGKEDYQTGGGGGEDAPLPQGNWTFLYDGPQWTSERPEESISFQFEEFTMTYTHLDDQFKSKGHVEYSWKMVQSDV